MLEDLLGEARLIYVRLAGFKQFPFLEYTSCPVRRSPRAEPGSAARRALMIAAGIGLHNFAEGLAIGNSAASGEISLAVLLIIGFGLHNATEGFGIVAPLAAEGVRPSWATLVLLGLI